MSHAQHLVSQSVSATQMARLIQMSGFQKIALLNDLAGNFSNGGWDAIDAQFKLIQSEFKELKDEIDARNVNKLRGELADMLVVIYGLAHRLGCDADADLHEVVLSNLTKFDPSDNPEAIQATVSKHLKNAIETVQIEVDDPLRDDGSTRKLYVTRSAFDQTGNDGKGYPKGKWLKSAAFVEPELAALPLIVQEKLGMVKVHRNLGSYAFGTYAGPAEGGYYARAIDSFSIDNVIPGFETLTVARGDLMFIEDKDFGKSQMEHPLPSLTQTATLVQQLDALPDVSPAVALVKWANNPMTLLNKVEDGAPVPQLLYVHIGNEGDKRPVLDLVKELGDAACIAHEGRDVQEFVSEMFEYFQKRGFLVRVISMNADASNPLGQEWLTNFIAECHRVCPVDKAWCTDSTLDTTVHAKYPTEAELFIGVPKSEFRMIDGVTPVDGDIVGLKWDMIESKIPLKFEPGEAAGTYAAQETTWSDVADRAWVESAAADEPALIQN